MEMDNSISKTIPEAENGGCTPNLLVWMNKRIYQTWIEQNITQENALENCAFWALIMQREFPELTIIKGAIKHRFSEDCYHEYLRAPDGEIVDPTAIQFDLLFGPENWEYVL